MKLKVKIALAVLFFGYLNPCSGQWLEIHQIGRGEGDSALILGEDVNATTDKLEPFVILIDAQRYAKSAYSVWEYVRDTVETRFPGRKTIDFIVSSHIHVDHFGGMETFIGNALDSRWRIGGIVDQFAIDYSHLDFTGADIYECYDDIDAKVSKTSAEKYIVFTRRVGLERIPIQPGPRGNLFYYKNFKNIKFNCLAANGVTIRGNNPIVFLKSVGVNKFKVDSENDLSFVWMLSFQGFHYYTGGDIGGGGGGYVDGETPVVNYMGSFFGGRSFHMCAMKVSHHGSTHSTNDTFLGATSPTISIVPASLRTFNGTALPTAYTLGRLKGIGTNLLYTLYGMKGS